MTEETTRAQRAGQALRAARDRLSWSQEDVSRRLLEAGYGGNQSAVSAWERGDVLISGERAVQLETIFEGALSRAVLRPDLFDFPRAAGSEATCVEAMA